MAYPKGPAPVLPDRHGGALRVNASKCVDGCNACVPVCPVSAIFVLEDLPDKWKHFAEINAKHYQR